MSLEKINNRILVHYGFGSVGNNISRCPETDRESILCIYEIPKGEINRTDNTHTGKTSDELNLVVEMRFYKPESVNVVIEKLNKIKENLLNEQKEEQ